MAISLLMPDGLALTAQQERQAKAPQHGGGSGRPLGGRSGFRVGTPSNILTATSTTWTLGACAIEIDPGASVDQGMYGWANSANTAGAMTAADATYARKDIVYIQINDPTSGDGTGSLSYAPQYLAGPMDGTNAPPALPVRSFLVGTISVPQAGGGSPTVTRNPAVYVAAGAPLPVSSQAERDALTAFDGLSVRRMDRPGRPLETFEGSVWAGPARHAEFITPLLNAASGAGTNYGTMNPVGAHTFSNTFCSVGGNGILNILEDGVYLCMITVTPPASLGNTQLWAIQNGSTAVLSQNGISYGSYTQTATFTVHAAAGDTIQFGVTGSNAVSGFGGAVKVTKLQAI